MPQDGRTTKALKHNCRWGEKLQDDLEKAKAQESS